jgi:hypothetical protein
MLVAGRQQRKRARGGAAFQIEKKTKSEATRSTSVLGRPKAEKERSDERVR